MDQNKPLISIEGALGIFFGIVAATADLGWEIRAILLFFAVGLVIHIARRVDGRATRRFGGAAIVVVGLILVTWRPIWESFRKDFPHFVEAANQSRIIEAGVVIGVALAFYWLIIRPRGKGWRVLPAELMAFGVCVVGLGLFALSVGLIWQFQQNRSMGIVTTDVSNLLPAPNRPQIAQTAPPQALPAPSEPPQPPPAEPLLSGYSLTNAGSRALSEEAFKIKDVLLNLTVFMQTNDESGRGLAMQIVRAFSIGGVSSTLGFGQLGGPSETGLIILFDDAEHLPEPAKSLKTALEAVGLKVKIIERKVGAFQFFVGPTPIL